MSDLKALLRECRPYVSGCVPREHHGLVVTDLLERIDAAIRAPAPKCVVVESMRDHPFPWDEYPTFDVWLRRHRRFCESPDCDGGAS